MVAEDLMATPIPRPRPGGSGSPQPMASAALRTDSCQSPSAGLSPGTTSSPRPARLRSRISSRSMPSRRAASSICDSTAQATCGVPNPRNAVAGGVCDSRPRTCTRASGTR